MRTVLLIAAVLVPLGIAIGLARVIHRDRALRAEERRIKADLLAQFPWLTDGDVR